LIAIVANTNAHIYAREEPISAIRVIVLKQSFLTWGAEINFRGCWRRSHM